MGESAKMFSLRIQKSIVRKGNMKKIIFILFGVLLTLNASIAQAQTTTLYTDLLSWEAMVLNSEALITTSTNIALADEVSSPPGADTNVGPILTFDSANTGLSRSFRIESLETNSDFIFNRSCACPTCCLDALNIGGNSYSDDDWQLSLLNGTSMSAFAVEIRDNQFEPGESISFYSKGTLMDTIDVNTFGSHEFYFIGVIADYTFDTVVFNEASGGENMGIANFRFGPSFIVNIDIIPNRANNRINVCRCGKVQVAILSTETFYAPDIMVVNNFLTFGSTGDEESLAFCKNKLKDINRDGYLDLVCFFKMPYTGFKCGDTEGILKGLTGGGIPFEARDLISPIPCR